MEKTVITIKPVKNVSFDYGDYSVEVRPYMTVDEQSVAMALYLDECFNLDGYTSESDYLRAEYALVLYVLDNLTSIDISGLSIDDILSSGLWKIAQNHIANYGEFRANLENVIKNKKEQIALEKSIGVTIDKLATKLESLVLNLSQADPEKFKESAMSVLKAMEESKIAPVFAEAQQEKTEKKVRAKRGKKSE